MNFFARAKIVLTFVYVLFALVAQALSFKCSYESPKDDEVVSGVVIGSGYRQRHYKRATHQKMRFHITFDKSVDLLDVELRKYVVDELVNESMSFWSSVLSVLPPAGPLLLYRKCVGGQYYHRLAVNSTDNTVPHACEKSKGCAKTTTCGEVEVPDAHLSACYISDGSTNDFVIGKSAGEGVNADFVLYVAAVNTNKCLSNADTIAYAAHCQSESTLDRPIAGFMNLCTKSLKLDLRNKELLISTIKHEMVHVLGFSTGLFDKFQLQNGEVGKRKETAKRYSVTQRNVTIQDWWTSSGKKSRVNTYLVTPAVTEAARLHFGCDKLPGVELENQGYDGTALTHFEKRIFENEAMTGVHTQSPTYSNLTFALLHDTGWYKVDFKKAEHLHWGYKLGCDFAMKSCGEWIKNRRAKNLSVAPFCEAVKSNNATSMTRCSWSRDSVALCNLIKYETEIPTEFQNFDYLEKVDQCDLVYYGGSVELADYCPFLQEFDWKNKIGVAIRDSRCELLSNTPSVDNAALEEPGLNSACFEHGEKIWNTRHCWQKKMYSNYGAGCYPFNCTDGRVYVTLINGTATYPCYKKGQRIEVRRVFQWWLHVGSIICPACEELCDNCKPEEEPTYLIGELSARVPCQTCTLNSYLTLVVATVIFSSFFAFYS